MMALYINSAGEISGSRIDGSSGKTYGSPVNFTAQEISDMLADGISVHVPAVVAPVVVVPAYISKLQVKRRFENLGLWDEFKVLKSSDGSMAEDWDLVPGVTIGSDFVAGIASAMQLDVDEFFTEASRL